MTLFESMGLLDYQMVRIAAVSGCRASSELFYLLSISHCKSLVVPSAIIASMPALLDIVFSPSPLNGR